MSRAGELGEMFAGPPPVREVHVVASQYLIAYVLIDAVRVCSLGQITDALFEVGGQYRRSM